MEFQEVNVESAKAELNLDDRAIHAAHQRLPIGKDGLDENQKIIVHYIHQRLQSARQKSEAALDQLSAKRQGIGIDEELRSLRRSQEVLEKEITQLWKSREDALINARTRERIALNNLNMFKSLNGLFREPQYPESKIFHWALVVLFLAVESIANAYFFSQASTLGLLGGAMQAIFISLVNIGTALIVGIFILPNVYHKRKINNYKAYILSSIYWAVITVFNLGTAHYRAAIDIDASRALTIAVKNLIENPVGIESYDAWVLFLVGMIFVFIAMMKGLLSDDRYPEFGSRGRAYEEAKNRWDQEKREAFNETRKAYERIEKKVPEMISVTRDKILRFKASIRDSERLTDIFNEYGDHMEGVLNILLSAYRSSYRGARAGVSLPNSFDNKYIIDENTKHLSPPDLSDAEEKAKEYESKADALESEIDNLMTALHDDYQKILEKWSVYLDDVISAAERELNSFHA